MDAPATEDRADEAPPLPDQKIDYQVDPGNYKHWAVRYEGPVATLVLDIDEDGGIQPGYRLKLNSYDLGVDIELHDALQRIRFEHPEVRVVVFTSGKQKVFCSGANIYMLGISSHTWKVNFCKFTNETRNSIEDSSRYSGLKFIAACNGATAGGGYELAMACDEILLIDDRNSAVSLPEIALLGVLPGTGGLTRLTDKRRVRRDHADMFCTMQEGVRGQRAVEWRLVDAVVNAQRFDERIAERTQALASQSDRPSDTAGIALPPLQRTIDASGYHYRFVDVGLDHQNRVATLIVRAPESVGPRNEHDILTAGAAWWPLQMTRELDDAILNLRTNEQELGLWRIQTSGDARVVLGIDALITAHQSHWFVREVLGFLRRTLARLDVSSRSLYAMVEPGSCFAGLLLELALAADRTYMWTAADLSVENTLAVSPMNFGLLPMANGLSRLAARFYQKAEAIQAVRSTMGQPIAAQDAMALGLITVALDDLDWSDEIRIALEERVSLSPDALSGLEANLRFGSAENMHSRIFGRLSAWQNWIFIRPNAVGPSGALKLFGSGKKPRFDWRRV